MMRGSAGSDGVILTTARECLKGCCAACAVPVGAFKAMQVAVRVALPKDITLSMTVEEQGDSFLPLGTACGTFFPQKIISSDNPNGERHGL
ncbi:MAG: hypothetical protein U1E27_07590 [Kiritimatiellia bacterium]|nr:hypothetical protein [Kiritimatiellia bacterium]